MPSAVCYLELTTGQGTIQRHDLTSIVWRHHCEGRWGRAVLVPIVLFDASICENCEMKELSVSTGNQCTSESPLSLELYLKKSTRHSLLRTETMPSESNSSIDRSS